MYVDRNSPRNVYGTLIKQLICVFIKRELFLKVSYIQLPYTLKLSSLNVNQILCKCIMYDDTDRNCILRLFVFGLTYLILNRCFTLHFHKKKSRIYCSPYKATLAYRHEIVKNGFPPHVNSLVIMPPPHIAIRHSF